MPGEVQAAAIEFLRSLVIVLLTSGAVVLRERSQRRRQEVAQAQRRQDAQTQQIDQLAHEVRPDDPETIATLAIALADAIEQEQQRRRELEQKIEYERERRRELEQKVIQAELAQMALAQRLNEQAASHEHEKQKMHRHIRRLEQYVQVLVDLLRAHQIDVPPMRNDEEA